MPFIWNDKTYWKRYKESAKFEFIILLPLIITSFIIWYIFLQDKIELFLIMIVSFFSAGSIYTFISIFKQFPNSDIPDTYSYLGRKFIYIIQFFAALIGLILIVSYIFNKIQGA